MCEIEELENQIKQIQKEYDILDGIIDIKDAVIAELKEENERLKSQFQIESLTDTTTGETIYRSNLINNLQEVSGSFANSSEAFRNKMNEYKTCLQEIKEIIKNNCWDYTDVTVLEVKDKILQKITKAEVA